ncbi:MAG: hypothetical protein AAF456_03075 [Planctomycetota bacterium]
MKTSPLDLHSQHLMDQHTSSMRKRSRLSHPPVLLSQKRGPADYQAEDLFGSSQDDESAILEEKKVEDNEEEERIEDSLSEISLTVDSLHAYQVTTNISSCTTATQQLCGDRAVADEQSVVEESDNPEEEDDFQSLSAVSVDGKMADENEQLKYQLR